MLCSRPTKFQKKNVDSLRGFSNHRRFVRISVVGVLVLPLAAAVRRKVAILVRFFGIVLFVEVLYDLACHFSHVLELLVVEPDLLHVAHRHRVRLRPSLQQDTLEVIERVLAVMQLQESFVKY